MNQPTIKEGVRLGRRVYLTGDEAALLAVITQEQLTRLQGTGALTGDWAGVFSPPPTAAPLVKPISSDVLTTDEAQGEVVIPTPVKPETLAEAVVENTEAPGSGAVPGKTARGKSKPAESKPDFNEEK